MEFPQVNSRHQIGNTVVFNADICSEGDHRKADVLAKIVGIKFSDKGKVLYDIAVWDPESPSGYYEVLPLRDVDSFMIRETGNESNRNNC